MHKVWAKDFWINSVTKSKNRVKGAFEKGFNEEYYETSSSDRYKLLNFLGPLAP